MAPPKDQLTVDFDELFSHARAVLQMQQPLDRVVAAVKQVTPDYFDIAYGTMCQPFAITLMPVRESAENTINTIATAVEGTSDQLIRTVDVYDKTDQSHARQLRAIGADIPITNNGLIAEGTKFDLNDYNVMEGGPWANNNEKNWTTGGGIYDNAWQLYQEVKNEGERNYGVMAGHVASIGADGTAAAADPVAAITGWAAGWLMEHLKPVKLILDVLAGNPEMVKSSAETWKNIGEELNRLAGHYRTAVTHGTGGWNGEASEAYREKTAKNIVDALASAGALANTMSIVVGSVGELVNLVRSATREIIADLIGELVSAGLQRLGYKPPLKELQRIAEAAEKLKWLCKVLLVMIGDLAPLIPKLIEAYKTLANIVPKLDGI